MERFSCTHTTPTSNKPSNTIKDKPSGSSINWMSFISPSSHSNTTCRKPSFISSVAPNTALILLKSFVYNFMNHEHLFVVLQFHSFFKVVIVIICPPSQLGRYTLSSIQAPFQLKEINSFLIQYWRIFILLRLHSFLWYQGHLDQLASSCLSTFLILDLFNSLKIVYLQNFNSKYNQIQIYRSMKLTMSL